MARYSDFISIMMGIEKFRNIPGNYIIAFADGSYYVGRQCRSTNRIRAAYNKWADALAVKFMRDHDDNECVRARRERNTIDDLLAEGHQLRNRIHAAMPNKCFF